MVICTLSVDLVFLIVPAVKYRKDHSILMQTEKELNHSLVGKRKEFYSTLAKSRHLLVAKFSQILCDYFLHRVLGRCRALEVTGFE